MILKILSSLIFSLNTIIAFSQLNVLSNGIPVANTGVNVLIKGNVIHKNNSNISNEGNFYITGDWTNNNSSDNIFASGTNGWVHLEGGTQTIGGSTMTHFNNLELSGMGIKQLINTDAEIEDTLSLNDREFSVGDNTIFVTSAGTGVIIRDNTMTGGFVSATDDGGLSRNISAANTYSFPVGSSMGTVRFRPIDITTNSATTNTFKIRMANTDATSEGYNLALKESSIGEINPNFYHKISHTIGTSSSDITLYFDNISDGDFSTIAQWQNSSQWKSVGDVNEASNYNLKGLTKLSCNNFSPIPFALADVKASVFIPNVFSPNQDGKNDVLYIRGKGIDEIQFIIYDRWGERVFESIDINTGWDGNYNGAPMNSAVFAYVLTGKFKNGDPIDKKGNVTLLR